MTYRVYLKGEHPAGFIGGRITVGGSHNFKQEYVNHRHRNSSGKWLMYSATRIKQLNAQAIKRDIQLTNEMKVSRANKLAKQSPFKRRSLLSTSVSGLTHTCTIRVKQLQTGANFYIQLHLNLSIQIDRHTTREATSVNKGYKVYSSEWLRLTRLARDIRGLSKVPSNWNQSKWTEEEYSNIMKASNKSLKQSRSLGRLIPVKLPKRTNDKT